MLGTYARSAGIARKLLMRVNERSTCPRSYDNAHSLPLGDTIACSMRDRCGARRHPLLSKADPSLRARSARFAQDDRLGRAC